MIMDVVLIVFLVMFSAAVTLAIVYLIVELKRKSKAKLTAEDFEELEPEVEEIVPVEIYDQTEEVKPCDTAPSLC